MLNMHANYLKICNACCFLLLNCTSRHHLHLFHHQDFHNLMIKKRNMMNMFGLLRIMIRRRMLRIMMMMMMLMMITMLKIQMLLSPIFASMRGRCSQATHNNYIHLINGKIFLYDDSAWALGGGGAFRSSAGHTTHTCTFKSFLIQSLQRHFSPAAASKNE